MRRSTAALALIAMTFPALAACSSQPDENIGTVSQAYHISFGNWSIVADNTTPHNDVLPVHAALLKNGKVFFLGGSQNEPSWANPSVYQNSARLFDPSNNSFTVIPSPSYDFFCSGQTVLGDGTVMLAGGNEYYFQNEPSPDTNGHEIQQHFTGINKVAYYNVDNNSWSYPSSMPRGRWYPTAMYANGTSPLVFGGHPSWADTQHENADVDQVGNAHSIAGLSVSGQLYPRLFALRGGTIFDASNETGVGGNAVIYTSNWSKGQLGPAVENQAGTNDGFYWGYGASAVLGPLRRVSGNWTPDRVYLFGGVNSYYKDVQTGDSLWHKTAPRNIPGNLFTKVYQRIHGVATYMPNGDIFISGGGDDGARLDSTAALYAEIYRPDENKWWVITNELVPRNYHQNALLLLDGRIWVAGSNKNGGHSNPDGSGRELRHEIFTPWYYNAPNQPMAPGISGTMGYNTTFSGLFVQKGHGTKIARVSILPLGSNTHSFNNTQRYIELPIVSVQPNLYLVGDGLTVATPPDAYMVPPGLYMIFVQEATGDPEKPYIPSKGNLVQLQ